MTSQADQHRDHIIFIEEGFRQGNQARILELYEQYSEQLIKWIQNNNGSRSDAEEIFQESMCVLVLKANNPDFVLRCPIGAYLYAIWRNMWLKELENRKRKMDIESSDLDNMLSMGPDQHQVARDLLELDCFRLIEVTFKQLSERCQSILQMVKKGTAVEQIVKTLNLPNANNLYSRKNRCITRWSSLMKENATYGACKEIMV